MALSLPLYYDADDCPVLPDELSRRRLEPCLDAGTAESSTMRGDEALAAVARAERHASPEPLAPVHLVSLAVERQSERHVDGSLQPFDCLPRRPNYRTHELRIASPAAEAHDVVRELLRRVWFDVDPRHKRSRDVLHEREEVEQASVDGPVRASGEEAVAASPRLGTSVDDQDARAAVFCGRECSAGAGMPRADDDAVVIMCRCGNRFRHIRWTRQGASRWNDAVCHGDTTIIYTSSHAPYALFLPTPLVRYPKNPFTLLFRSKNLSRMHPPIRRHLTYCKDIIDGGNAISIRLWRD